MNIFDAERRFVGHRSGRQGAICQGGELAGDVDCVRGTDGLGVRARYWMGKQVSIGAQKWGVDGMGYTRASLFGLDGRDVCHVGGSGGVVDSSFEI